jgi:branched-chain amino acid transport system ATP-binding protein
VREPLLTIKGLRAGYGKIGVLHGVDLTIGAGEVVTLLGPNGAGKTTLLNAVSGPLAWESGDVTFAGGSLRGIGVRETARVEEALSFFPEIAAKQHDRCGVLSGGQQQMLAVAQGLVRQPRLLMLDEPSAGLSPVLVDRVLDVVRQLRDNGTAVLLVEQLIEKALALADRVYALARGRIVLEAPTMERDLPHRLEQAYFGQEVPSAIHA